MKMLKSLIAPVLAAVIAATAANAALYQWSKTAATNATADATINWSEGMSPGSVNDSARAMMARVAEWRDDTSGALGTTGTSTAFVVATNQGLPSTPTTGQLISITPHVSNGVSPTLQADGGTAFPIQTTAGSTLSVSVLIAGTSYDLKFNGTAWVLKSFYANPLNVPIGAILDYSGSGVPNNAFAFANGQCISRTTYALYFALVGEAFGACDGSTTFAVPDLSNRFVAGAQMGGTARITVAGGNFDGNTLGASGGLQNHTLTTAELPVTTPAGTVTATGTVSAPAITSTVQFSSTGTNSYAPQGTNGSSALTAGTTAQISTFPTGAGGGSTAYLTTAATGTTTTYGVTGTAAAQTFTGTSVTVSATSSLDTPPTFTDSGSTFNGSSFGSGAAHTILPPAIVLTKIVRIQ